MPFLSFKTLKIKFDIHEKYKAHLSENNQSKETLKSHIDLAYDYFLQITKQNNLEPLLNSLFIKIGNLFEDTQTQKEFYFFIKYLFAKAIYWHDMGKINPIFQKERMLNNLQIDSSILDSHHSKLSAYLFINHSMQELYATNIEETEITEAIIHVFGFLISKHHGQIYQYQDLNFQSEFSELLSILRINAEYTKSLEKDNRSYSKFFDYIESNHEILFFLSKSLFSLLIISDYYATAQFMNYGNTKELLYSDFGLIDDIFRETIYENFYKNQFEKNLKNKTHSDFKDFKKLEKKSNENLNHLRNKLLVEVKENLKKTLDENIDQHLFYIEAPTGAGKTNLSLMSAVEILKKDNSINKIFYVFPFTTLITQTYISIKKTLELTNNQIVQLHSKARYNQKHEEVKDGVYGNEKTNFLDNQFMNYPIALLSHVKFFDILTGVNKDANYLFHRFANSIVIIDEIQTYNPIYWSKVVYLMDIFAKNFNIKFIVMSATLPKIDKIIDTHFIFLTPNKQKYFTNPNFSKRVKIDTSTIQIQNPQEIYEKLEQESKIYKKLPTNSTNSVKTIIEFITKKGADQFYKYAIKKTSIFDEILLLSGTILEPRRQEIISLIKNTDDRNILLVSTQVVEAGVDIDMDIGFKEKSLVDSDEQLAGRINRNSSKQGNILFLFTIGQGNENFVYKNDKRKNIDAFYQENNQTKNVLDTKDFDKFYDQVLEKIINSNTKRYIQNLDNTYIQNIKNLNFKEARIKLIDMQSISVFVPHNKMAKLYWKAYEKAILNDEKDFIKKKIHIKRLSAKITKYTFSLSDYQNSGIEYLNQYGEEKYGFLYLRDWNTKNKDGIQLYTYSDGLDTSILKGTFAGMIL